MSKGFDRTEQTTSIVNPSHTWSEIAANAWTPKQQIPADGKQIPKGGSFPTADWSKHPPGGSGGLKNQEPVLIEY